MKLIRTLTEGRHFRHEPIIGQGNDMYQISSFPELEMLDDQIILDHQMIDLTVRDLKPLDRFPLGKSDLLIRMVAPSGRSG